MIAGHEPRAPAGSLAVIVVWLLVLTAAPARADPIGWPQPGGPGTPVVLSYSFSNLFDPVFQGIPELELRAATADAFGLWSRYAPLHFIERPDSGPPPSDIENYLPDGHPAIRIGAHEIDNEWILAHSFLAVATEVSGLAGDIHLNRESTLQWGIRDGFPAVDILEVLAHEIGHALGLGHILETDAIMNPNHGFRFGGRSPFLLPSDIAAVQAVYGAGAGSVHPIPEPSTLLMLSSGLIAAFARHARRRRSQ